MSHFSFWVDAPIIGLYLLATMAAGIYVRKYVGKVEHFLVAGREMNVFLGIASLAATEFGIVTCMYTAQQGFEHGFSGAVSGLCQTFAMFLIGITGFCIKPLRDAGVITVPELLEKQFGSRVRWAAGLVIILGGLLNMGVFLRVGGEFLLRVTGIDTQPFPPVATAAANATQAAAAASHNTAIIWMMTVLLIMVAVYTIMGGMLSVLVTDFLQFVVMSAGLIAVTVLILMDVGWTELSATVTRKYGAGGYNPFLKADLGWRAVVFWVLLQSAATLTWQPTIARVLAAKDTNTGRKIYTRTSFFFVCRFLIPGIWGIAALAYFTSKGIIIPKELTSYAMPHYLAQIVPIGLMGILVAAMLAADMSTDSAYMLTWGSVIYNDLLAPFHKRRWSEKTGLLWNRCIVAGIGVFLFFFGLWYEFKGSVWEYLGVTGSVYLSSMATLLISCCYWKRANNWGAIGAIIAGAVVPLGFLILQIVDKDRAEIIGTYNAGMAAYGSAGLAMIIGSLLKHAIKPESATPATNQGATS